MPALFPEEQGQEMHSCPARCWDLAENAEAKAEGGGRGINTADGVPSTGAPLWQETRGVCTLGLPALQSPLSVRPGRRAALRWGQPSPPRKACPYQEHPPPRLSPWLWGMLGGLLGSLPPQLHKRLGLTVPLPALQQPQDWVPCEERRWGLGWWGGGRRQCLGSAGDSRRPVTF